VKAGLVATRISVTKLNHEVVRHFASEGIPAVGISPLSAGWCTKNKNVNIEYYLRPDLVLTFHPKLKESF
jgi:isopentenyl phosphate kinase